MAEEVIEIVKECINDNQNFILEAGAGSGKTHTLMQTIHYLQNSFDVETKTNILCITYTNVAKNEIRERLSTQENITVNTMHEFLWGFIKQFQNELRKAVYLLIEQHKVKLISEVEKAEKLIIKPSWNTNVDDKKEIVKKNTMKLARYENVELTDVSYKGFRALHKGIISHDEVLQIAKIFLDNDAFLSVFTNTFTHVFIDEYQDADSEFLLKLLIRVKETKVVDGRYMVVGLFGDQMQRIYSTKPLGLDYESLALRQISKLDNYRTCERIILANNKLRGDGLIQEFRNEKMHFSKLLFVYNLSDDFYLKKYDGIEVDNYKELFLSHREIAKRIGFASISEVFQREYERYSNEKLLKMEDEFIRHIINDIVEILHLFSVKKNDKLIKRIRRASFNRLELNNINNDFKCILESNPTLEECINDIDELDVDIRREELNIIIARYQDAEKDEFIDALMNIRIQEYIKLFEQVKKMTSLDTLHGVKGAEFSSVVVNMRAGQRWTTYNFDELFSSGNIDDSKPAVKNAHMLFYVACTRAQNALVINYITDNDDENFIEKMSENISEMFDGQIETIVHQKETVR